MPDLIDVPLSGPTFARAVRLVRDAVAAAIHGGGTGWEASLEPTLTELANDRALGGAANLLLISLAARCALATATVELELDGEAGAPLSTVKAAAERLADELLTELIGQP